MHVTSSSDVGVSYSDFATYANTYNASLYHVTGRIRSDVASNDMPARTSKTVWWKGFKDSLVVQSTTSDPWKWRRIVFSIRGGANATGVPAYITSPSIFMDIPNQVPQSGAGPNEQENPALLQGVPRAVRNMSTMSPGQITDFTGALYKGVRNIDFDTGYGQLLTAAVDKENVRVHSDTIRSINSGNDSGVFRQFKSYVPLNQTMVYADQESGSMLTSSSYAASHSPLGDVYIFDLFVQLQGAPSSLTVSGQGTAYWHEK